MRYFSTVLALALSMAAGLAYAQLAQTGAGSVAGGGGGGGIVGALLLEDGSSIVLLEDGASFLCLEGGC